MTLRSFRCQACAVVYWTDLELSCEEFIEMSVCPVCAGRGHLEAVGDEIRLCRLCADSLPEEPEERFGLDFVQ